MPCSTELNTLGIINIVSPELLGRTTGGNRYAEGGNLKNDKITLNRLPFRVYLPSCNVFTVRTAELGRVDEVIIYQCLVGVTQYMESIHFLIL